MFLKEDRAKNGRFVKGIVPWNKGKKCPERSGKNHHFRKNPEIIKKIITHPNTIKTRFKKGIIPWNKGKTGVYSRDVLENISSKTREAMQRPEIKKKVQKTQYKKGHVPWSKGRKRPEISGDNHPFRKDPSLMKKIQSNPNVIKNRFKKGITPWNKGKTGVYSNEVIARLREARLSRIFPKKDTSIEVKMQKELEKRGFYFQKHTILFNRLQPDIIFPGERLAVFCDGDYWHANPAFLEKRKKSKLDKSQMFNRKRDEAHNKLLKDQGWQFLRFWESDIKENVELCVDKIEKLLR